MALIDDTVIEAPAPRTGGLRAFISGDHAAPRIAEQLVSLIAPGSFAADQYRTLRHSIERMRKDAGLQVLAVTSPGPGDGKSITTINLAGALAQSPDARVLVIDADLRRPTVAEYLALGARSTPGLSEAIQDAGYTLERVVRYLDGFNLSVLPAGTPEPAPYELLNSPRLESLIRQARQEYDFVLIDTPPTVPFPDCRLLSRWADGLLVIVAANKTPRKMLAEALDLLDPSKVIGVVLNGDNRRLTGHYGYYHYYHAPDRDRAGRWWRRGWRTRQHHPTRAR